MAITSLLPYSHRFHLPFSSSHFSPCFFTKLTIQPSSTKKPASHIIELGVTYQSTDYPSIAERSGVNYHFSFGGRLNPTHTSDSVKNFQEISDLFKRCQIDPSKFAGCYPKDPTVPVYPSNLTSCFDTLSSICSKSQRSPLREAPFLADVDEIEKKFLEALKGLESVCEKGWDVEDAVKKGEIEGEIAKILKGDLGAPGEMPFDNEAEDH